MNVSRAIVGLAPRDFPVLDVTVRTVGALTVTVRGARTTDYSSASCSARAAASFAEMGFTTPFLTAHL